MDPLDVGRARQFTAAFARYERLDALAESLVLVTSELVSNAIRHATSAVTITLRHEHARVRVEVADDGDGIPHVLDPDPTSDSGRGLMIVAGVAREWGSRHEPEGKVVWAELEEGDTS
jgi:two-component sensor histidine kinase